MLGPYVPIKGKNHLKNSMKHGDSGVRKGQLVSAQVQPRRFNKFNHIISILGNKCWIWICKRNMSDLDKNAVQTHFLVIIIIIKVELQWEVDHCGSITSIFKINLKSRTIGSAWFYFASSSVHKQISWSASDKRRSMFWVHNSPKTWLEVANSPSQRGQFSPL